MPSSCSSVRLLPGEYFAEKARIAVRDYHPIDALYFAGRSRPRKGKSKSLPLSWLGPFFGDMSSDLK
jgi:hypothetical protein